MTTLSTVWDGSRMSQRSTAYASNSDPLVSDAGYDFFGARTQWNVSRGLNSIFNVDIERDVLSRVRSVKTGFGAGPTKWQGFEYDNRHHFTVEHYADSITTPGPSVGTHDLATNDSI
jgi:hypothetical protein